MSGTQRAHIASNQFDQINLPIGAGFLEDML
jgi:hypothetical protein